MTDSQVEVVVISRCTHAVRGDRRVFTHVHQHLYETYLFFLEREKLPKIATFNEAIEEWCNFAETAPVQRKTLISRRLAVKVPTDERYKIRTWVREELYFRLKVCQVLQDKSLHEAVTEALTLWTNKKLEEWVKSGGDIDRKIEKFTTEPVKKVILK